MKKINKQILVPISLSLLTITLAGCNDDDNAIFGSGSSNEFTVSSFDKGIDRQTNREAVVRIDSRYRTGERDVKSTNIVGNYNNQNIDDLETSVVLANQFDGTLEDKNIEVNSRTVKRPVYEKNNNKQFNYETTYRTISLSGVDARDYTASNNFGSSRGIFTDLNNYPKIPTNLSFPAGSVCYIPVTTSDRSFFIFSTKDKTGYQTLGKWTENAEKRFSDNRQSSTTTLNIGSGNKYKAVQVKFFAVDNDPEYLSNGIDYDGSIYNADFIDSTQSRPNEDSLRGVVDCTLVNDVAADFLEIEIKRYY
ncbi:hypothetical protein [Psychrobacter urativorans]|uniref:hypothetical protein n=1 Tax=Psychrobacter urativorans TaxID=45610 RepID=UPI001919452D|nr:hypothetical protein [Psychrobacter urativorans]